MTETDLTEPDREPGAPHPRETPVLYGQAGAEAEFLQAFAGNRLHHGWLLTGPRGIGKATLAWRIARFLLATPTVAEDGLFGAPPPPATLDIPAEHPVARRMLARSEPGLAQVIRSPNPETGKMRKVISVDDVRGLHKFFSLTAADGGRRVVIVDAADEMNPSAANAILKMLEEPPARALLLLVSHQPARLLPTIRSRCRSLRLAPLSPADLAAALAQAGQPVPEGAEGALAELAGGSVGTALRLLSQDGLQTYARLTALLATLPRFDRAAAQALADSVAGPKGADRAQLLFDLIDIALARIARTGAQGAPLPAAAQGEAQAFARLAPDARAARAWAEAAERVTARARHGLAVNLDPAALVLDTVLTLAKPAETAQQ